MNALAEALALLGIIAAFELNNQIICSSVINFSSKVIPRCNDAFVMKLRFN